MSKTPDTSAEGFLGRLGPYAATPETVRAAMELPPSTGIQAPPDPHPIATMLAAQNPAGIELASALFMALCGAYEGRVAWDKGPDERAEIEKWWPLAEREAAHKLRTTRYYEAPAAPAGPEDVVFRLWIDDEDCAFLLDYVDGQEG